MKKIPLTKGRFALVSTKDYARLSRFSWCVIEQGYAYNTTLGLMHRAIVEAPRDKKVDHRNHNPLDNRRSNLRVCTHSQNQLNRRAAVGVYRFRHKWIASIQKDKRQYHLGVFETKAEALVVRRRAARKLFGAFAPL